MVNISKARQFLRFQKFTQKLMSTLPKMEGASGSVHLSKTQLEIIGESNGKGTKEIISQILSGTKNPSVDIAYKSKSNYSIAGLRIKDGRKVVGSGAISIVNPNSENAVVKYRASFGKKSKLASVNGFLDAGVPADSRDFSMGFVRRNGKITSHAAIGESTEHHLKLDEDKLLNMAAESKSPFLRQLADELNGLQINLQSNVNSISRRVRRTLGLGAQDAEQATAQSAKANAPKVHHYGKHKIKRYLYHMTSEENYQSMLRDGKIHVPDDAHMNEQGVFMTDLQNLLKRWRYSKDWSQDDIKMNLSLALLGQVSKSGNKIVCLRIPTAALDHDLLKIRSQNRLFRGRSAMQKWSIPKIYAHKVDGAPAVEAGRYKQRKEALEYIYPQDIPMDNVELVGRADVDIEKRFNTCGMDIKDVFSENNQTSAVMNVFRNLFSNQPEEKAVKNFMWEYLNNSKK